MPFADGAKTQNESTAVLRRASLIGVPDNAWIEQGRRLERIFMKKIRSDQPALRLVQFSMWFKCSFHLRGSRLEEIEQISVTTFKIFEHICQLPRGGFRIEPKHSVDDMIGPDLVGWVEISGFSRGLEGADDDPSWIRAQI